ncbi:type I pantothenate kinase [Demequina sp. TTPB684]|uniref:type I pantothenate kinase n=1 Tax=unclassified Demequina TaxID=2620311 RepID=UPI001CF384D7|nr:MULTISPECIES: type I pantothenate kinase [unclassified Demequina]MCB2412938.1 type I pantothenate kinase [Demequina sp. TTPB684]UPU88435.1 type I pantothenate kinase [Demequina sp. TMPB413]
MRDNSAVSVLDDEVSVSPFLSFTRAEWSALADATPLPLTADDVRQLRGLGDPIDLREVDQIFRPLSRLLTLYSDAVGSLHTATSAFLGERESRTPFVVGIAGSVAVGKSTTARVLREMLARWPSSPRVELVTTDGFLLPNAVLEERGLMGRKGFPESYDRRALRSFIAAVKSGVAEADAPVYSHVTYDIVPDERITVRHPDILIVEGLNVLQPAAVRTKESPALAVSDYFDASIYVDAEEPHVRQWYIDRFLSLRGTAFARPDSYFQHYAHLSDDEATAKASHIWDTINKPNLKRNIEPTRSRATIILRKGKDHAVQSVHMRKL